MKDMCISESAANTDGSVLLLEAGCFPTPTSTRTSPPRREDPPSGEQLADIPLHFASCMQCPICIDKLFWKAMHSAWKLPALHLP